MYLLSNIWARSAFSLSLAMAVLITAVLIWRSLTGDEVEFTPGRNANASSKLAQRERKELEPVRSSRAPVDANRIVEEKTSESFERVYDSIVNLEFPPGENAARVVFEEEMEGILHFPASRDRDYLMENLIKNYIKSTFDNSGKAVALRSRLSVIFSVVEKSEGISDKKKKLLSASAVIAGHLANLTTEARLDFLGVLSESGDQELDMANMILGASHARDLLQSPEPSLDLLSRISDEKTRKFAEEAALLNFDYAALGEEAASNFAEYYLSNRSQLESDHEIEIKLFGAVMRQYPEAFGRIISESPPSLKRDKAIEQLIYRIASIDLDAAKGWYEELNDPAVKARAMLDLTGKRVRAAQPRVEGPTEGPKTAEQDPFN